MMAKASWLLLTSCLIAGAVSAAEVKKTYIVQIRKPEDGNSMLRRSLVEASLESVSAQVADVLYTYENTVNGYAATFTNEQAEALKSQPEVLSVRPDKVYHLHTSRSPQFLGLVSKYGLLGRSTMDSVSSSAPYMHHRADDAGAEAESNLIIGVFDTGAWPENPSYRDDGFGPIPARWKGECEEGDGWTASNCNNKLIGARAFYNGYVAAETNGTQPFNWTGQYQSARDDDGHGTHTSTTAGGSAVQDASLFGQASGTARGMAEFARLAIYKVCWKDGCFDSDILAAMDKAVEDGVNVMSLSLGPDQPSFDGDEGVVVGSFAAIEKGIFVSVSAGNLGPEAGTVTNLAPWTLNVAASSLDRDFPAHLTLGNGKNYTGSTLYSNGSVTDIKPLAVGEVLPLIHGSLAGKGNGSDSAVCLDGSLDPAKVTGKVVLCVRGQNGRAEKGGVVKAAGGRGMVLVNAQANGEELIADAHILPALHLGFAAGSEVETYAKTSGATVVFDFEGTRLGIPAPYMAAFSSRGPNMIVPGLAKPDITGPGVSILAGWAGTGPAGLAADSRKVDYNIISGTSMACPHLSGIAAYLMARRPGWSPAAIRSAMMTTAYVTLQGSSAPMLDSANMESASPFSYGNGHVDPVAALDPGLVYDLGVDDYLDFLCAVNTSTAFVSGVTRSNFSCDTSGPRPSVYDFNYPSFSALYDSSAANGSYTAKFTRTVTNVGVPGTYEAAVSLNDDSSVKVSVEPDTLTFGSVGEKQSYVVTATLSSPRSANQTSWGRLIWSDGEHSVGSSLTFLWGLPTAQA